MPRTFAYELLITGCDSALKLSSTTLSALREHAIERERRLSQPMHAPRHAFLGSLNAAGIFLRER